MKFIQPHSRLVSDAAALAALLALATWYFLPHVLGQGLFIGDSDRMSHFFTWLVHLNEGVRQGYFPTWSDRLFGGYSTVGLPYIYFNPLAFVGLLFPPEAQNWVAGWTSLIWLWASGISAYFLLRFCVPSPFYAFVGAALYESSAVSMLKISQSEGTYSIVALTPLLLLCLHAARPGRFLPWVLAAIAALTYLFSVGFLQEAAYACLLLGAFALYRLMRRDWYPLATIAMAGIPAFLISLPRIINVAIELRLSNRMETGGVGSTWLALGAFNPFEVFRLLDDRIAGRYFSHALELGNGINLHEGMVAYVSTFALVVCFSGFVAYLLRASRSQNWFEHDIPFHAVFVAFCLSVVVTKAGYAVMYYLFFKVGFIHARVTTVAMPSLCLLTAIYLYVFSREEALPRHRPSLWRLIAIAIGCAIVTGALELMASSWQDERFEISRGQLRMFISEGAALRVGASIGIASALLWIALRVKQPGARLLLVRALGLLAVMQLAAYAKDQTSGPFMQSDGNPFPTPTRMVASAQEFKLPSAEARTAMRSALEADSYRITIVCDPRRISIYCTPYMATSWGLREIGGYVSSIPSRLSWLPWPTDQVGLRSIVLPSIEKADWGLLALLNVRYVVDYHPALLTNAVREGAITRELRPQDLKIHRNPHEVMPRVFFAESIIAKENIAAAAAALFPERKFDPALIDVRKQSYVEGPPSLEGKYSSQGKLKASFRDQFVSVQLEKSSESRFLVFNERYHPAWRAWVDGVESQIMPTNIFMRGVLVPAGAQEIRLQYCPFSLSGRAVALYLLGLLALLGASALARRADKRASSPTITQ